MTDTNPFPYIDDNKICWKDCTSSNGIKYQVGYLSENLPAEEIEFVANANGDDFGHSVNWPVGTNGTWVSTDTDTNSIAQISRYNLYDNGDGTYQYYLYFTNTDTYNYYFYDKTGDSYQCNTFRNGNHFVRYNSKSPAINYIKGT